MTTTFTTEIRELTAAELNLVVGRYIPGSVDPCVTYRIVGQIGLTFCDDGNGGKTVNLTDLSKSPS
jgi:hypothetical protein